jgi:hypothetical protein
VVQGVDGVAPWDRPRPSRPSARSGRRDDFANTLRLRLDRSTGAIVSLKLSRMARDAGGRPTWVAEKAKKQRAPGDFLDARPLRDRLGTSGDRPVEISAASSPLSTVIDIRGTLLGQPCRRRIWLHKIIRDRLRDRDPHLPTARRWWRNSLA